MLFEYRPAVVFLTWIVAAAAQSHPCQPCHPREVARFQASAMGQSLSTHPGVPDGSFTHKLSGSVVTISHKQGILHTRVDEAGLTADYPIAYAIGAGKVGKSFLIDLDGRLFQSPASFYTRQNEWDASPGYEKATTLGFDRRITLNCLACHAGSVRQSGAAITALTPITCERCHGPSEQHLKRPVPGSIINPAKLTGRVRDSVCEQCHLEGAAAVLNPGKTWTDFRPGEPLESTESHFVYRTDSTRQLSIAAVSHAEELALSACLRGSSGKLWCGTCHDPHGEPVNRQTQIAGICKTCHAQTQLAAVHPKGVGEDCVPCHMPRRQASDITHAAVTDHRIVKRPTEPTVETQPVSLSAWQPVPPEFAVRNLGLALFDTAKHNQSGEQFQRAFATLARLPNKQIDAQVLAAEGYMLLGIGETASAIRLFGWAIEKAPESAEYALDLGVARNAAGDTAGAIASFRKSIALDPYDERPYRALADLYNRLNQPTQAQQAVGEYLKLVPQSLTMRHLPPTR